jgi:hypothetical protein
MDQRLPVGGERDAHHVSGRRRRQHRLTGPVAASTCPTRIAPGRKTTCPSRTVPVRIATGNPRAICHRRIALAVAAVKWRSTITAWPGSMPRATRSCSNSSTSAPSVMPAARSRYAGAVAFLTRLRDLGPGRAALAGAGTSVGIAAMFVLMTKVPYLASFALIALFIGGTGYLVFRRDLGQGRAVVAAVAAAVLLTGCALFVSYLAVMAYIAAAGIYLVLGLRLRVGPALLVMGTALGGLLAASAAVFAIALASM